MANDKDGFSNISQEDLRKAMSAASKPTQEKKKRSRRDISSMPEILVSKVGSGKKKPRPKNRLLPLAHVLLAASIVFFLIASMTTRIPEGYAGVGYHQNTYEYQEVAWAGLQKHSIMHDYVLYPISPVVREASVSGNDADGRYIEGRITYTYSINPDYLRDARTLYGYNDMEFIESQRISPLLEHHFNALISNPDIEHADFSASLKEAASEELSGRGITIHRINTVFDR